MLAPRAPGSASAMLVETLPSGSFAPEAPATPPPCRWIARLDDRYDPERRDSCQRGQGPRISDRAKNQLDRQREEESKTESSSQPEGKDQEPIGPDWLLGNDRGFDDG